MPESQYRATETGREPERSARVRLPSRANALRRSVRRDRLALPNFVVQATHVGLPAEYKSPSRFAASYPNRGE